MQLTCPRCSERFDMESAVEDESGRAFMGLLSRIGFGRELVVYIGLFRPRTQALRWSRALALAEDIDQLAAEHGDIAVTAALRETVEAMRPKLSANWKPLRNHNYLMRVLESVLQRPSNTPVTAVNGPSEAPKSKTSQALTALQEDDV